MNSCVCVGLSYSAQVPEPHRDSRALAQNMGHNRKALKYGFAQHRAAGEAKARRAGSVNRQEWALVKACTGGVPEILEPRSVLGATEGAVEGPRSPECAGRG